MFAITDQHIDFVLRDLDASGIKTPDLQQNLLDHLCILAERNLAEGDDFYAYYRSVIPSFYRQELAEIEAETTFLLGHRGPWLLLSRLQFLCALFVILVGPFIAFDLLRLLRMGSLPLQVWGGTLIFMQFPFLVWLVIALTPERYDPLLPKGAKVLLGWRPFISIL
jgi:hypothetical protein